ncbi:MAG: DUF3107 family protein [Streptosporangiales bacterium]|nr:DUF3107 family protein [Streptosporangiales bacterium]
MELKIGMQSAPREVVVDSTQSLDELRAALDQALLDPNGILTLDDSNGRQIMVFVHKITYIELTEGTERRIGFGSM